MRNRAGDPSHAADVQGLRDRLAAWERDTEAAPEPPLKIKQR
jgi:hypothetical protein